MNRDVVHLHTVYVNMDELKHALITNQQIMLLLEVPAGCCKSMCVCLVTTCLLCAGVLCTLMLSRYFKSKEQLCKKKKKKENKHLL